MSEINVFSDTWYLTNVIETEPKHDLMFHTKGPSSRRGKIGPVKSYFRNV